jgi:hypothetical protein
MSTSRRLQESTNIVESSVSLLVAKTQFTLAVQIAIEALINKCGYSRERATTTLLKELNRSSNNSNSNSNSNNYLAGSGSGCGAASANVNNKPTDDEVRIVYGTVPILDNIIFLISSQLTLLLLIF